jgi:hypothetical protein
VDPASLALGLAGATPVFDLTNSFVYHFSRWDVNDDGWPDLVAWFAAADTGLVPGDSELCLEGKIEGSDFVACDEVFATEWACGLGAELALLLPPLMWVWRRRVREI